MKKNDKKSYPTQVVITIRVIVGAYVLYNMYDILTNNTEKSILMYIVAVLMGLAGLVLVVIGVKNLIMGEYEGGRADKREASDDEEKTADKLDASETGEKTADNIQ